MGSAQALKLLLDTHIWIWSLLEPNRLARRVRAEIESPANELWLSPLSIWEFFMLCRKGRVAPERGTSELAFTSDGARAAERSSLNL